MTHRLDGPSEPNNSNSTSENFLDKVFNTFLESKIGKFLLGSALIVSVFLGIGAVIVFGLTEYVLSQMINGILTPYSFMENNRWVIILVTLGLSCGAAWIWVKSKIPFVSRKGWYIIFSIGVGMFVLGEYLNRDMYLWNNYACTDKPADYPYKSNNPKGKYSGAPCIKADAPELVAALKAIQDETFPSRWELKNPEELKAFDFNRNGKQIIYASKTMKEGKHQLYYGPGIGNSGTQTSLDFLIPATEEMKTNNLRTLISEKTNSDSKKLSLLRSGLSIIISEIASIEEEKRNFSPERIAVMSGGLEIPEGKDVYETGPRVVTGIHKYTNKPTAIVTSEYAKVWEVFISASPSWIILIDKSQKIRFSKLPSLYSEKDRLSSEITSLGGSLPNQFQIPSRQSTGLSLSDTPNTEPDPEMSARIAKMEEERVRNMLIVNSSTPTEKNIPDMLVSSFRIEFLKRDPPKEKFIFLRGGAIEGNRVSSLGPIKIIGERCIKALISIDNAEDEQICGEKFWIVEPGQVWKIKNNTGIDLQSLNVRVEGFN